jgi:MFS family permease
MQTKLIYLLKKQHFFPLFLTQFFGAFNDNAFKFSMLTLISYFLTNSQAESEHFQAIASGLFIFPFFLLSATAGQLADKYDKSKLTRIIKLLEILLTTVGGVGLYFGNIFLMMITLVGFGIHSTFFGPIKYAILPDHLQKKDLLGATALIEASTFLAILLGTTLGTMSIAGVGGGAAYSILLIIAIAIAGFAASWFIPKTPQFKALKVDLNPYTATRRMFKRVLVNPGNIPVFFGISWFWLIAGIIIIKLPDYTNYVLRAQTEVFALFLALFSIGIGVGSFLISYRLKGVVTLKYIPHTLVLLSVFLIDLYFATPKLTDIPSQNFSEFFQHLTSFRITLDLFFLAFSCGIFLVPLYAYLQTATMAKLRARTIAANNISNAFFMVIGSIFVMVLLNYEISITTVFFILGILNLLAAWLIAYLLKTTRMRSA